MAAESNSVAQEQEKAALEEKQSNDETKDQTTYLRTSESKEEMANALTSLISTFRDETQKQEELLSVLQNDAMNNTNFAQKTHALKWSVNEVCYWLITMDLQDYINIFHSSNIDGAILFHDINENMLKNELNVKPIHCSKIIREIDNLKNSSVSPVPKTGSDTNLNDIIANIKKENEVLLAELEKQKLLNKELSTKPNDFHSISNGMDMDAQHINGNITNKNNKSLSDVVESQNKIIQDLTNQLQKLQKNSEKKIRGLRNKNKNLQDGYIQIETHYQTQLEHSRTKSKNLQVQLSNMNQNANDENTWNNNIGLLWNENENTAKDLENEKEKRIIMEASLRSAQLSLNTEKQKRILLESQTSRLTNELTKYLTSIDKTQSSNQNNNGKKERFARFKKINKHKNNNHNHNDKEIDTKEKNGWQKFLNAAGNKIKTNKENTKLAAKSFHLPKQLSLSNIQQKLRKKSNDTSNNNNGTNDNINDINNINNRHNGMDEHDHENKQISSDMNSNPNVRHSRKVTLGETVIKTFKKIQSATKAKMEERANKKQIKKESMDSIKEEDRFYIKGSVFIDEINSKNIHNNKDEEEDNKVNVNIDNDNDNDNYDEEDDDDEYVMDDDEDSSAAEAEYQLKKTHSEKNRKQIVISAPNEDNIIHENNRDEATRSPISMEIQFVPAMEALKQTQEMDTDASF